MRGLISLVNENRVDNNIKEILVYVYFGSIVNYQPKHVWVDSLQSNQSIHTLELNLISRFLWSLIFFFFFFLFNFSR